VVYWSTDIESDVDQVLGGHARLAPVAIMLL